MKTASPDVDETSRRRESARIPPPADCLIQDAGQRERDAADANQHGNPHRHLL
jgi:hypothetical protein